MYVVQYSSSFDSVLYEILQNVGFEGFRYRLSLNVSDVVVENGIINRHFT